MISTIPINWAVSITQIELFIWLMIKYIVNITLIVWFLAKPWKYTLFKSILRLCFQRVEEFRTMQIFIYNSAILVWSELNIPDQWFSRAMKGVGGGSDGEQRVHDDASGSLRDGGAWGLVGRCTGSSQWWWLSHGFPGTRRPGMS